jgi:hypothetical protein
VDRADLPLELAGMALPGWAAWLAQDEDGTWWAYEAEPNQQHNGWYENEVGRIQRLLKTTPAENWRIAIVQV